MATKEIVASPKASAAPTTYKVVDADDVFVAPAKYQDKPIEIRRVRCFHADKAEYRCIGTGSLTVTIFASSIRPQAEREAIEEDCGEIRKMLSSPKCLKTIRFVPAKHSEDLVSGMQKRMVVITPEIEVSAVAAKGRR